MGPSATVDLMDKIIKNTPAEEDQDYIKMIVESIYGKNGVKAGFTKGKPREELKRS